MERLRIDARRAVVVEVAPPRRRDAWRVLLGRWRPRLRAYEV